MYLYHGTPADFDVPTLNKCKPHRDFGRGFYLATNYFDALPMAVKTLGWDMSKHICSQTWMDSLFWSLMKGLRIGFGSWFLQGSAPLQMSIW